VDAGGAGADGDATGEPERLPLGGADGAEPAEVQAASPKRTTTARRARRARSAEGTVI